MIRELINVDCRQYMKGIADKNFDICVTSPPYNMNLRVNSNGDGYCSRQIIKEISSKYQSYDDNLPMEEYFNFIDGVLSELLRTTKLVFFNIQIVTGNKPALFKLIGKYSEKIKELIVWDKCKAQPAIGAGVLNSGFELILVLADDAITRAFKEPKFERGRLENIWRIPAASSEDKTHGAAFPRQLVANILRNFAEPGQRCFDPFMGTGTTAIESHYCGLDFVGTELDKDYYDNAVKRIEAQTLQEQLFK